MPFEPNKIDTEKKKKLEKKTLEFSYEKEREARGPEKQIEIEKQIEVTKEKEGRAEEEKKPSIKEEEGVTEPAVTPVLKPAVPAKSATRHKIESILEEDLSEVFGKMNEEQKKIFKEEGEKTATRIEELVKSVKDKAKEILGLIRHWLKLIPGVNKFFLEQEAKIKTDKILKLKQKKEEEG